MVETEGVDAMLRVGIEGWADRRSVHSALESAIDLLVKRGIVDPDRIGLTGLSDGASTVAYALMNSGRYRAAAMSTLCGKASLWVIGPAVADQLRSMGYPPVTSPTSPKFWNEGSIAAAPERVRTPLLLQLSDDEYSCALEDWTALKELRRPVEMYVFPNEHHIKWQPQHRLAIYRRNLQWFQFWLLGEEPADPLDPGQHTRWRNLREMADVTQTVTPATQP